MHCVSLAIQTATYSGYNKADPLAASSEYELLENAEEIGMKFFFCIKWHLSAVLRGTEMIFLRESVMEYQQQET